MSIRGFLAVAIAAFPAVVYAQGVIPTNNATIFSVQPVQPTSGSSPLTGSIARPLGNHLDEATVNVKDFGAVLNGTTDDSAAFTSAYSATPNGGVLLVPPGGFNAPEFNTAGETGNKIWRFTGNSYGTGTFPVGGGGTDIVETLYPGNGSASLAWFRSQTTNDGPPLLRADQNFTASGTQSGYVVSNLNLNGYDNGTQDAAFTGSISGTTLTVSTVSSGTIKVGDYLAGAGMSEYMVVQSGSGNTWTITNPWNLTISSESMTSWQPMLNYPWTANFGMTINHPGTDQPTPLYTRTIKAVPHEAGGPAFESDDATNTTSQFGGALVGLEIDIKADNADNGGAGGNGLPAGYGIRPAINADCFVYQTSYGQCATAYGTNSVSAHWQHALTAAGNFDGAAVDLRYDTEASGMPAIALATGQSIGLDTSGTGGAAATSISSNGSTITATGNVAVTGSMTLAGSPVAAANTPGAAATTPTVGASPYAYTATVRGEAIISGGTVTAVTLTRGSTVITMPMTSGAYSMMAGDVLTVTYSAAPTMNFVPL